MPQISILIPAFNAGCFIAETLRSVFDQSLDSEVIVVDDGSSDDTYFIALGFEPKVKVLRATGKGAQAARNQALKAASGKYVKFLDADDILLPGVLNHQIRIADELPENHITYGPAISMSEDGVLGKVIPHYPRPQKMDPIAHILYYSPLTSCPLHRRSLLGKVGGMDDALPREHENDLHIRLALSGAVFVYDSKPVYAYRQHTSHFSLMKGGVTRFGEMWMLEYLEMQEKRLIEYFGGTIPTDVARYLALFYWKSGRSVLREGAKQASKLYFDAAQRVSPRDYICGTLAYRTLVYWGGPIRAEKFADNLRQLIKTKK